MGVYGNFLTVFPELKERIVVWSKDDHSDERTVVAIYITSQGSRIKRRKYTSGNTSLDIEDEDTLYVSSKYQEQVHEGDYFKRRKSAYTYRIVQKAPYDLAAGYQVYTVERVTGATPDKDQPLPVKEGYFA